MLAGNRDYVRNHPVATKRAMRAIPKASDFCAAQPERAARRIVDRGFTPRYDNYALHTLNDEGVTTRGAIGPALSPAPGAMFSRRREGRLDVIAVGDRARMRRGNWLALPRRPSAGPARTVTIAFAEGLIFAAFGWPLSTYRVDLGR